MARTRGRPKNLATVAREGDHLATLRALRDYLAKQLDQDVANCEHCGRPKVNELTSLSRRLESVMDQIAVAERRAARAAPTPDTDGAAEEAAPPPPTAIDQVRRRRAAG